MEKRYLTKKMGERDLQETKASAGGGFMTSLATFIVDKRNLFFLLTILMLVFSAFSRNWVEVESELAAYLPSDSQTRQALDVMEEQFTTCGTAQIMAANISQAEAEALQAQIAGIKGVQGVEYDNTEAHYNKSSALYTVTFDYDEPDEACLTSLDEIRSALSACDLYVSTELGNAEQEAIDSEVSVIMVYVAVIIVLVLLFTSQTYAEVPVLILTFVVAMIMNLGTNFLLGKISFVSNSVTSILQLALSLDYAVIFCNRCKEEHQNLPIREAAIVLAFPLSQKCPYAYGESSLETPVLNETQIAQNMIDDTFTSTNMLALMVPAGDYEKEAAILEELSAYGEVDSAMGIANVEAMDGCMLADKLTPREFAELTGLDYEAAQLVYAAYGASRVELGQVLGNLVNYQVPLIDMFLFVCDQVDSGLVTLDDEQTAMLDEAYTQMTAAKKQLQGSEYSRMLVYLNLPESGDETYQFLDTILETAQRYYPDEDVYLAGNSTTEYDFQKAFSRDNLVVSVVSILIVLVVLLFTFQSAGMPALLILVIQGSIWINFSVPYLLDQPLFFMSCLVVSSIQMGANIDYAIVVANRYQELKSQMSHRDAIIETMNFAFPTIITSGTILAAAGTR